MKTVRVVVAAAGWWPPSSREGASASHVQMRDKSHIPAATFAIAGSPHGHDGFSRRSAASLRLSHIIDPW